uniref:Putative ovule protein n=1 Tax=Solanum chacoense TaxID=4108 RepID=A0A0V0GMI1_SOLCH
MYLGSVNNLEVYEDGASSEINLVGVFWAEAFFARKDLTIKMVRHTSMTPPVMLPHMIKARITLEACFCL